MLGSGGSGRGSEMRKTRDQIFEVPNLQVPQASTQTRTHGALLCDSLSNALYLIDDTRKTV